eukprot:scaffold3.g6681.t1
MVHLEEPSRGHPAGPSRQRGALDAGSAAKLVNGLAAQLARAFGSSAVSSELAASLAKLLPGIEFASVSVVNPTTGFLVGSTNFAAAGPATLHLFDGSASLAGLALESGKLVQGSLQAALGPEGPRIWQLPDMQQMLVESGPGGARVAHVLCLPFGAGPAAPDACEACKAGRGAITLGFAAKPALSQRRLAVLSLVAESLARSILPAAQDTLQCVDYMCGMLPLRCSCSECEEEEEEEEGEGEAGGSCRDDGGPGGRDRQPPAASLAVPGSRGSAGDEGIHRSDSFDYPDKPWMAGKGGAAAGTSAAAAAAAAAAGGAAAAPSRGGGPGGAPASLPGKAFLSSLPDADLEGRRHPLWLRFASPALEGEFVRWQGQQLLKVDVLFSLSLLAALAVIGWIQPYCLSMRSPRGLLLGAGCALPLVMVVFFQQAYLAHRERFAVAMRLYVIAFINFVCISIYQSSLPTGHLHHWLVWATLSGAESLLVTVVGFQVRYQLHVPLQFAVLAIAALHHPTMCAACFPGAAACQRAALLTAALVGYAAPTAVLRHVEGRARAAFVAQLRGLSAQL